MIIRSKRVWLANQFVKCDVEVINEKITNIYPYESQKCDVDYENKRIVPGFIDVHTHGAYGFDTNDAKEEGLRYWLKNIPEEGVTSILPTTVTQTPKVLEEALRNVYNVYKVGYEGAEILGVHFEGPYLDMDYKGAQPPEAIQKPTVESFKKYQEAAGGLIKYITIAPEHDKNYELIHYLRENKVVVSMGHSSATYEEALMAVANGVTSMTHVYNGMTKLHHRDLGLVGAAYRIRDIYGEIIGDGMHSSVDALNIYYKTKGPHSAVLITDSLRAKGCKSDVKLTLGGHEIEISKEGLAYIKGTNTIAGSTLRMNKGLKILVEDALIPFDYALNSCTCNPANCLGVGDRKGYIRVGYDADLVILDDNYEVVATYTKGKLAYKR